MAEKFITSLGLREVLNKLYDWLPFKKNNDKIEFSGELTVNGPSGKYTIEIKPTGEIYVLDLDKNRIHLQAELAKIGSGGVDMTMSGYDEIVIPNEGESNTSYDIKNTDSIKMAIKKLDKRSDSIIIEKDSKLQFPTIGKRNVIYREKTTGKQFIWDSINYKYTQTSTDVIYGGSASDFNE